MTEIARNSKKNGASKLHVHLSLREGLLKVFVQDNGRGMNGDVLDGMGLLARGEGTNLMIGLAGEIGCKLKWTSAENQGTMTVLMFKIEEG